ncbi:MAG: glycyl-radical enzyme activating protein [Bacillota bacterium]
MPLGDLRAVCGRASVTGDILMTDAPIFNIQHFSLHDGEGIRTTVFFQGCNLRCRWCSNPESQPMEPLSGESVQTYSVPQLLAELLKDKPFYDTSGGGVTLSGGEPLLYPEYAIALCRVLHEEGVHVTIETAANISEEIFSSILGAVDCALIDLKHYDNAAHIAGTGIGNAQILSNIVSAVRSATETIVRIPVIPGYNDSLADARAFADTLARLAIRRVHILPFHQFGESKYHRLNLPYAYDGVPQQHEEDLEAFAAVLKESQLSVQIGG